MEIPENATLADKVRLLNEFRKSVEKEEQIEKEIKKVSTISEEILINRFSFHPVIEQETKLSHEMIRNECLKLAILFNKLIPDCEEKKVAINQLDAAMMWANAGIARNNKDFEKHQFVADPENTSICSVKSCNAAWDTEVHK